MDETVIADCPTCGEAEHAVLKTGEASITVRCLECDEVRTFSPPRLRLVRLRLTVSDGHQSWTTFLETPSDEDIAVGHEFEHEGHRMLVTGMETVLDGAPTKARASDIRILQAKVFDQVALKLSLNEGEVTHSYELMVEPDAPVHVGEVYEAQGRLMAVKTLKSDQNRTLHKGYLLARNVRRAFCDPAPEGRQVGEVITTRRRGAPANRKGDGPTSRVRAPGPLGRKPRNR